MRFRTRAALVGAALALSLAGLSAGTASADAHAAPRGDVRVASGYDGVCDLGELCLYYNSDFYGSMADFYAPVEDFAPYRFLSSGNGRGQGVKNNAASACNMDEDLTARIHYNSGWRGIYDDIPPYTCRDLVNTYNDNASLSWR